MSVYPCPMRTLKCMQFFNHFLFPTTVDWHVRIGNCIQKVTHWSLCSTTSVIRLGLINPVFPTKQIDGQSQRCLVEHPAVPLVWIFVLKKPDKIIQHRFLCSCFWFAFWDEQQIHQIVDCRFYIQFNLLRTELQFISIFFFIITVKAGKVEQ